MLKKVQALSRQEGQALLIVVLVMVVALTVTLSVVSRSIVNLKTSLEQTDSQKALAAAEAGIEQKIKNNSIEASGTLGNVQYTTKSDPIVASSVSPNFLIYGGNTVPKNQGAYIWLTPYGATSPNWSGNLTIYWGDSSGDANNAALEIAVISGSTVNNSVITRYAVDPHTSRVSYNHFTQVSRNAGLAPIGGVKFYYSYTLPATITNGRLVRVIPIYKSTSLGAAVSTVTNFPQQGQVITATATSGDVQRKITVFQGYPELSAEFFPYTILSP